MILNTDTQLTYVLSSDLERMKSCTVFAAIITESGIWLLNFILENRKFSHNCISWFYLLFLLVFYIFLINKIGI